jgi:hypothetical protein
MDIGWRMSDVGRRKLGAGRLKKKRKAYVVTRKLEVKYIAGYGNPVNSSGTYSIGLRTSDFEPNII